MFSTIAFQIFNLVVPTLSNAEFLPTFWLTIYVQATFLSAFFFCYGLQARKILKDITSQDGGSCQVLVQRLDFVMIPWAISYTSCTITILLLLLVDAFVPNQYILMPVTWFIEAIVACCILIATRSPSEFTAVGAESKAPQVLQETPVLTDREISRLSDTQIQSEISGTSTSATPILPNRSLRLSPLFGTTSPQLLHRSVSIDSPDLSRSNPLNDSEKKFRLNSYYAKGVARLEEGDWIHHEIEIPSLTIDTTDRNPKPITVIEDETDGVLV